MGKEIIDEKVCFLIGYDIKDNGLRDCLKDLLVCEVPGILWINQSAYKAEGMGTIRDMKNLLIGLCREAEKRIKQTFGKDDFVKLYYSRQWSKHDSSDWIVECVVYPV